jgi:hypothetical protein
MRRILLLLVLVTSSVWGQCVMCQRTAAAQQAERARVLNHGIVILLVPPVAIFAGVLLLAHRRRD